MTTPGERIIVVCFAAALLLLKKPLGRMTATWQRMIGPGVYVSENTNRVFYVIGGLLFLIVAIWAN